MKKTLLLLTILSILVSPLRFTVSAYSDVTEEKLTHAVELLQTLGVMLGYEGDIFRPDDPVTRAELAMVAARMIGAEEKAAKETSDYTDVPRLHWARGAIEGLTDRGILSGSGDGLFRPEDSVTAAEAYKMMLCLAGYGPYAEAEGGFPLGYDAMARSTKISLRVSLDKALTRGEIALLAVNTLTIPVLDVTSYSGNGVQYDTKADVTLLSRYRDIYVADGQVTAVPATTLTQESSYQPGKIAIDDVWYDYGGDAKALIGNTVKAYYKQTKDNDTRTIVYLYTVTRITDEVVIAAKDILSFDENTYTLTYQPENGATPVKAVISKGASVIHNGVAISTYGQDTFMIGKGRITLKRSSSGGSYDVVVIEQYENIIVGVVDTEREMVYDYYTPRKYIDLSGKGVVLKTIGGLSISISDLKEKDILTVLKGSDSYAEVYRSGESLAGTVEEIQNGDTNQFLMDGVLYDVDQDFLNASGLSVLPGSTLTYKLDAYGVVSYFETSPLSGFGYVIKGAAKKSIDAPLQLKILTQSGAVSVFDCAGTLVLNGTKKAVSGNLPDVFQTADGSFKPQLIRYERDDAGKIKKLDTVQSQSNSTNALQVSHADSSLDFRVIGLFGSKTMINNNTLIFSVPEDNLIDSAPDDWFAVLKMGELAETTYDIETYKTKDKVGYEEIAVLKMSAERPEANVGQYVMVDRITTVVNGDGDTVECLYGYLDGSMSVWNVKPGFSLKVQGIRAGDIIDPAFNGKSEIYDAKVYYSYGSASKPSWGNSTTDLHAVLRLLFGYPAEKVDSILKISYNMGSDYDEVYDVSNAVILVYDPNRSGDNKIYRGTAGDIALYANVGNACSQILMQTSYAHSQIIFVYNK